MKKTSNIQSGDRQLPQLKQVWNQTRASKPANRQTNKRVGIREGVALRKASRKIALLKTQAAPKTQEKQEKGGRNTLAKALGNAQE